MRKAYIFTETAPKYKVGSTKKFQNFSKKIKLGLKKACSDTILCPNQVKPQPKQTRIVLSLC